MQTSKKTVEESPEIKDRKNPKTVLLFSGGLDSYLVQRLYKPDVLLYCACNHQYQRRELKAIKELGIKQFVHFDETLDLAQWERRDAIIPLRNLLFSAVASRYGDIVWLGALSDEINWDKSKNFMALAGLVMTECYRESYWSDGREIYVESPVKHLTKAQLIRKAREAGIQPEEWSKTVSCYTKDGFCGECSSCFKRWVAHTLNGISEKYKVDPLHSQMCLNNIAKVVNQTYRGIRAVEVVTAIDYASNRPRVPAYKDKQVKDEVEARLKKMRDGDFSMTIPE